MDLGIKQWRGELMALVIKNPNIVDSISNWESYATVKIWKKSLAQNSDEMELAKGTYNGMKTWFPRFLKSTISHEHPDGLSPDELIEEALADPMIIKDRLADAFIHEKKIQRSQDENSNHSNTVIGIYGSVRGFYSHNLSNMPKIRTPKIKPRTVMTTDAITPLTEITTNLEGKKIVDIDRKIFQRYMQKLPLRDQVVVSGLLSSGMDSGDIVKVTVGMIREQAQHERIFFSNFRAKTGEILNTFWSKEATTLAREYITDERSNADDNDPLFIVSEKQQKRDFFEKYHRQYTVNDFSLLPERNALTKHRLAMKLREGAKKMKIKLKKGVQSPLRPKKYRKLFSDACDKAGIGENKRKIFMGKSDKSDKIYAGTSRHQLEIYYELVEPYVTIYQDINKENYMEKIKNEVTKNIESKFADELKQRDLKLKEQNDVLLVLMGKLMKKSSKKEKKEMMDIIDTMTTL